MTEKEKKDKRRKYRQNSWITGETGQRITAQREDDLYKTSSPSIKNLLITDLGTLEVAKQYTKNIMADITGEIVKVIDTRYDFLIVATTTKILTIKKSDFSVLSTYATTLNKLDNIAFIDTFIMLPTKIVEVTDLVLGTLAENTVFKSLVLLPLEERSPIICDIYQIRRMKVDNPSDITPAPEETSPYKIGTVSNPEIEMKGGALFLKGTGYGIKRFYINYQNELGYRNLEGLVEDEFYLSVHNFLESDNSSFVLGNKPIVFNEVDKVTDDVTGEYYTKFTGIIEGESGQLDYGTPVDIFDSYTDLQEFQNRMVIAHNGRVYFSAVADFNNFRNDVNSSDPFYFKLSPINSEDGNILKLITGRGLYITTDKGVYIAGYDTALTPSSISIQLATDENATNNSVLLNDILFFMNNENKIMGIQNISTQTTMLDFKAFSVDKYSLVKDYGTLGICRVGGIKYMFSNSIDGKKIYLFKAFDIGNFVRTTLEIDDSVVLDDKFTGELTGYQENFFGTGLHFSITEINKLKSYLEFNIPSLNTINGGYYMNDVATRLTRFVLKVLDEEIGGIKAIDYVSFNSEVFNKLGNSEGIESVYKLETGIEIYSNKSIEIVSKENENVLEIQAYELFFTEQGD